MKLETMYQEIILDHYRNPHGTRPARPVRRRGPPREPDLRRRGDAAGARSTAPGTDAKVVDVSYDAMGCSISQAATSVLTDLVVGHTVGESFDVLAAYQAMVQSRGKVEPDEDVLDDAVAFAGVAAVPGPRQVRAAGVDGVQGRGGAG